jgi:hypothetical protein
MPVILGSPTKSLRGTLAGDELNEMAGGSLSGVYENEGLLGFSGHVI